jgi:hypothetical protein
MKNSGLFFSLILLHLSSSFAQTHSSALNEIISGLDNISINPRQIAFRNSLMINNNGGHLQGIQRVRHQGSDYYIVSGSSDQHSYYSIIKAGENNLVISNNMILEKPFKHAGGFQICDPLMAVGVEDNEAKDKSKVFIFQLDSPERPPEKPLAIIDRLGTEKRASAGCIGIAQIRDKVLIVVGDWDTIHLDFYVIDRAKLGLDPNALELEYTINTGKTDKKNWIDTSWLAYQNINIITPTPDLLLLAGMATNKNDEDILDLYQISTQDLETFRLTKVYTKNFGSNAQTRFRWGAGIHMTEDGSFQVLSTQENISEQSIINLFQ